MAFLASVYIVQKEEKPPRELYSSWTKQDEPFEQPLRPQTLHEFVGQKALTERLEIFITAAKQRHEALGHCLFHGPPGLGKTTLAHILAKCMGTNLVVTSGPVLEKASDLAGLLTHLQEGDILFIDEMHRIPRAVEEYLYPAMENFALDLLIDSGPAARSVQVKLNPFTLVGATTRIGLLKAAMRSRFALSCRLDYYDPVILAQILTRSSELLHVSLTPQAAMEIALRARGTPRIANHLLRWTRDYAQIQNSRSIDHSIALQALQMLAVDEKGLDETDKKVLSVLIDHYQGGPVGLQTLAIAIGEEPDTLAEIYEPFLIMQGFIKRTPRGRQATPLAFSHLRRPQQPDDPRQN